MCDNNVKREVAYEMLEYAGVCFVMGAQNIPNAYKYNYYGKSFQSCANGFLQDIYEEELLLKCLEECPL